MKINEGYSLKYISGVPYILPFGQNIADYKRGIRIDDTGALIWKLLQDCRDEESLLKELSTYFSASDDELSVISNDLRHFFNQLISFGIVTEESSEQNINENYVKTLKIGGIYIDLFGEEKVYSHHFDAFTSDRQVHADLTIVTHLGHPPINENGTLLLRNKELCVIEREECYIFIFPEAKGILQSTLICDGSRADFYVMPPLDETLTSDMFHAIRPVFLYLAQIKGMFALHSASIVYKDKLWLFSGRSGMGKSTHTALWNKLYNTPIANGDLNLITISDGTALVHGIPWCGTSNICDTNTYPLGGIVLLGRSSNDVVETLSDNEKILLVIQRFISPSWTDEQLSKNIDFSSELIKLVPVCRLKCTDKPSAAEKMKSWIDSMA